MKQEKIRAEPIIRHAGNCRLQTCNAAGVAGWRWLANANSPVFRKLIKLINGNFKFADPIGLDCGSLVGAGCFAEVICSIFIILGLGTRLAAIPLIVTMGSFWCSFSTPQIRSANKNSGCCICSFICVCSSVAVGDFGWIHLLFSKRQQ
ncbi:MAG: DoxX family protein [Calditrichia bacterium]